MGSEQPVGLLMAEDLHQAVGVRVGLGSAVRGKRKLANFVGNALRRRAKTRLNETFNPYLTSSSFVLLRNVTLDTALIHLKYELGRKKFLIIHSYRIC